MPRRYWPRLGSCPEPMAVTRLRLIRGRAPQGTWRRRSRFWRMIGSPTIWPAMGALALAVGIGVQLGESAVRDIDPLYFQGPAARPAGVDPVAEAPAPSGYAQAYGWEAGNAARLAESNVDYPYAPTPIPAALPAAAATEWQEPAPPPLSLAPWPAGQVSAHPEIERYTDYPIEQKATGEPAPAGDEAPDDDSGE
jgi:hypothetical protein